MGDGEAGGETEVLVSPKELGYYVEGHREPVRVREQGRAVLRCAF